MGKTLLEISRETGLSTATVSRVLNGAVRVSPQTRERVLAAVAACGYEKPARRRSAELYNNRTVMIIAGQLQNPIISGFIDGIRARLAAEKIRAVISLSDYDTATECDTLEYAVKNGFLGIFMLNAIECRRLVGLVSGSRAPIVFVNRFLRELDTDVVTVDNYRCGYMATKYLIDRGHRRISHIAGPETSVTCRDRTQGYTGAMRAAGLEITPESIYFGDRRYRSGCDYGDILSRMPAERRPTAVFSTTGLMAAGMVDRLRGEGLRVPNDVSVICNDDYSRDYMPCPIDFNTYEQNPDTMGRTAAQLMLDRLASPEQPPKRIVFPPVLTEHNSVLRVKG